MLGDAWIPLNHLAQGSRSTPGGFVITCWLMLATQASGEFMQGFRDLDFVFLASHQFVEFGTRANHPAVR
jgi:hypothetical protein